MKKALLAVMVLFFAIGANAQLLVEQFNYTDHATNGLALQSNLWNKVNTGDSILITNGSLSYPGVTPAGNKVAFGSTGTDYWRAFTSQTTGTVYYSFLLNVTSLGSLDGTGGYVTTFIQDASTTTFGSTVWLRLDGSGYNIGVSKRTTVANVVWSGTTMDINTTYFIVVSYQFNSGTTTDDVSSLWINPALGQGSAPAADLTSTSADTDLTSVARVLLRQDSAAETPDLEMDEITIAIDWPTATLPVELTSFTAVANGRGVELAWKTASETNNYGFEVERSEINHRSIGSLNQSADESMRQWNKIGFIEGHGTTNAPKSYSFVDGSAGGTVAYRLKQIDRDGSFEYSNQVEVTIAAPAEFALMQNHPNPFNPATSISYTLPVAGQVSLKIYDMLGKEVATLVNGMQDAGAKIAKFDASQLPSGMYFYTLRTQNFSATKKMLLVK